VAADLADVLDWLAAGNEPVLNLDKLTYAYTGHVTGRLAKTNEAVDSDFTCKADYDLSSGLIETHFE